MRVRILFAPALLAAVVFACSSNLTTPDDNTGGSDGTNAGTKTDAGDGTGGSSNATDGGDRTDAGTKTDAGYGHASITFAFAGGDFTGNSVRICGSRPAPDETYECSPLLSCSCFNFNADGNLVDSTGALAVVTGLCPSADSPSANWSFDYGLFSAPDCGGTQLNDGTHNSVCYDSTDIATQAFPNQSTNVVLNPGLNTNHILCNATPFAEAAAAQD
ncbi:MAG: hypothetical protein FWD73_04490 [Polyangiaceae bacterium]|nr:hypothetical protein [Polyangiaceae bacterium]